MDKQTIKGKQLWLQSSMLNVMPVKKKEAREQTDRYFPQASDHPVGFAQTERASHILPDGKILCDTVKRTADSCTLTVLLHQMEGPVDGKFVMT